MKKLLSLLGLCRDKNQVEIPNGNDTIQGDVIQGLEPLVTADPEAIEIFINSDKDKFAELYYKNKGYTYMIAEKHYDDYEEKYYWCPGTYTASYFDTRERAIEDIISIIERK